MSSSVSRGRRQDALQFSSEFDSIADSEEPVSPVVRLQKLVHSGGASKSAPPPLPPKPAFARGVTLPHGAPPPLPPKPDNVRGDKLVDFPLRPSANAAASLEVFLEGTEQSGSVQVSNFIAPPTRPLPALPKSDRRPSYGESESWIPSNLDERSQLDPPQPPEPTILSDGEPIRSSLSKDAPDTSTQSLSDHVPKLTVPLPPPPYTVQDHRLSCLFQPLYPSNSGDSEPTEKFVSLSLESAEDAHIGAIVLGRERCGDGLNLTRPRMAPIQWRPYTGQEPRGEAWSVLHEYLTNDSLKAHGRNRALQLLTGYVVGACLESQEAGNGLLSEIVRRMRGAERSERDGSIFTLLINIAAHASFVKKVSWTAVEEVARKVFSDVVEEMHGRQDDDVMWERALRCFLILLESSNRRPSDQISSKCLASLALHIGDMTHTDIDHVLITEGLCPRLQNAHGEYSSSPAALDLVCLEEIGGLQTILTIFVDTASPSARSSLFSVLYDFSVLKSLEGLPVEDVSILQDHIVTLRAVFEAYEMADLIVHAFRVGPWEDFVMDVIRIMLFDPLTQDSHNTMTGRNSDEAQNGGKKAFQEKEESASLSETRYSSTIGRAYQSSAGKYLSSIRAVVRLLDKPFSLKVVAHLATLAHQQCNLLSERETMRFAREWSIIRDIEAQLMLFRFSRSPNPSKELETVLRKIYVAVVDITSGRSNMKSILQMTEMVISLFVMKLPFSKQKDTVLPPVESIPALFLKGQMIAARELLHQANPSIFTLLLLSTRQRVPVRRLSECRQALVELLGSSKDRVSLLDTFTDDEDPAVAYRAAELVSRYTEVTLQPTTQTGPGQNQG